MSSPQVCSSRSFSFPVRVHDGNELVVFVLHSGACAFRCSAAGETAYGTSCVALQRVLALRPDVERVCTRWGVGFRVIRHRELAFAVRGGERHRLGDKTARVPGTRGGAAAVVEVLGTVRPESAHDVHQVKVDLGVSRHICQRLVPGEVLVRRVNADGVRAEERGGEGNHEAGTRVHFDTAVCVRRRAWRCEPYVQPKTHEKPTREGETTDTRQAHDEIGGVTRGFGEVAQGKAYRNWVVRTIVTIETATRFFPNACRCSFLPPPRPHESTRQKQSQAERTILHFFGGGRRIFGRELRHLLRCRNAKRSSDLHARHTRRGGRIRPSSCVAYSIRARGTSLCTAFGVRVVEPAPRKRPAAVRTRVVAVIVGRPSTTRSHHGCRLWEANSLAR